MKLNLPASKNPYSVAIAAAFGATAWFVAPVASAAPASTQGQYLAGDFHNHTTCSDGSVSMQKLIEKVSSKDEGSFGLDWFVQAGHGGSGYRNCTLVEDESLTTPVYPYTGQGPTTSWQSTSPSIQPKGLVSGSSPNQNMWRWQSIQEFQYPLTEYLAAYKDRPLFMGIETNSPGHEHVSASVISGQIPAGLKASDLPTEPVVAANTSRYTAVGNANSLAKWEYCFDRNDSDTSRGNTTAGGSEGNNWDCSVPGSANASDPSWNATAQKLMPASGTGSGTAGHAKSLESLKWMANYEGNTSYYVPAHLERAGPFNPDGNNGYNVEHLRDFNNTAPDISFGFETQPGHGASSNRGEYQVLRNTINGVKVDSVGGTTYGGTGVYGAQVGGVWDALLGEGRNWWFFASSDWHNRGSFSPDDRRSTQDFYPGEYQRNYTFVTPGRSKLSPQTVVDGLRTGNNYASSGQLIDRLAFVACEVPRLRGDRSETKVEALAIQAAVDNTSPTGKGCATMGEKLEVASGSDIVVAVAVRDPSGSNFSPYTFPNPSLQQIGLRQPLNMPVLDHIDLIGGMVTGYIDPSSENYAGEWPRNTDWLHADGTTADLSAVPAAAKNTSAAVLRTFNAKTWRQTRSEDKDRWMVMSYRLSAVAASQYLRLRGTNMPAAVPYETDGSGNPLADVYTNAGDTTRLAIPCTVAHSAASQFDGCPDHLATATGSSPIAGKKAVSYDIAAWSDLWFYANPIYVQVAGSSVVAGVN
jgi:hypothetical protein